MRTLDNLFDYQKKAVGFQCSHAQSALWLDMGLGKTVITLSSIQFLIDSGFLKSVIIVAPIRVCRLVWRQEAVKWEHTKHLTFSMVVGTKDQRTRALLKDANIYLINYENLEWLATTLQTYFIKKDKPIPFDGIVYDEISKCFPAGTLITTKNSALPIESVRIGDIVMTHLGPRRVLDTMKHRAIDMVNIGLTDGRTIHCTPDHPFLLDDCWVSAGSLKEGDYLYEAPSNKTFWGGVVRDLRGRILEATRIAGDMFQGVRGGMENASAGVQGEGHSGWYQGAPEAQRSIRHMEQRKRVVTGDAAKNESGAQRGRLLSLDWWEWVRRVMGRKLVMQSASLPIYSGVHLQDAISTQGVPHPLQDRFWRSGQQDSNRNSRANPHHGIGETKGLTKTPVLNKVRVDSVVHYKQASGVDVWNITVEEAETYFAGGVLVHNCKNSGTNRVKALKKVLTQFKWSTGLTGSPASNGYKDLHGQYLVLDQGVRLGTSKTAFMTRWYKKADDGSRKDVAYRDTEEGIKKIIADITLEMSAADFNPLPDLIVNDVEIELPDQIRAMYETLEREFFLTLDNSTEIEVFNQASLTNKLLQFSNGAMYPVPGLPLWEPIHDEKLIALGDIIDESNGQPVLCSYSYRSDAERIMKKFAKLEPINLTECKSEKSLVDAMWRWTHGDCQLMIGHPASMGHGVDGLQQTGHTLVWFGLNWSLDLYDQFNARIRRQGQGVPVICHRLLTTNTMDQAQALAIEGKAKTQTALRNAIKEYRKIKLDNK